MLCGVRTLSEQQKQRSQVDKPPAIRQQRIMPKAQSGSKSRVSQSGQNQKKNLQKEVREKDVREGWV